VTNPHWPFFGLRVRTPRLELRYPDDRDATDLATLAGQGIHAPDFMPFLAPWTDQPSPDLERSALQYYWRARADLGPHRWTLPFAVVDDGEIVGLQAMEATDFAVTRTVKTGSWVGRAHQGRGIGKEMRAAVLHLAFEGMGAREAMSGAVEDNPASLAVSRSLGYEDNGFDTHVRRGQPVREVRLVLSRVRWRERRRDDVVIDGLEACLPLLGLAPA